MAKNLPFFKFFCSEWNDGDITLEDYKTQGVFINICSYYWSKECNVPFKHIYKRFKGVSEQIDILVSNKIIYDCEGKLCVKFLDEQLEERKLKSEKNRKAANKRWLKDANAMQTHSERNAIKIREEKIIDNNNYLESCLTDIIWLQSIAMKNKLKIEDVKSGLNHFNVHLTSIKKQHNNLKE